MTTPSLPRVTLPAPKLPTLKTGLPLPKLPTVTIPQLPKVQVPQVKVPGVQVPDPTKLHREADPPLSGAAVRRRSCGTMAQSGRGAAW